jgi:hypothetical protein
MLIELLYIGKDICQFDRALWLVFDEYGIEYSPSNPYRLIKWFPIFMECGASIVSFQKGSDIIEYKVFIFEHQEDHFFFQLMSILDDYFVH